MKDLIFYLRELLKSEQNKPKVSRRKEIIRVADKRGSKQIKFRDKSTAEAWISQILLKWMELWHNEGGENGGRVMTAVGLESKEEPFEQVSGWPGIPCRASGGAAQTLTAHIGQLSLTSCCAPNSALPQCSS